MRIEWIGDKESTFMTLAVFAVAGGLFGLLLSLGTGRTAMISALGIGGGAFFWLTFAVQDLRLSWRKRPTRP